ncbi:MAG: class II aldolase/adducin family protein [Elusimicrobiales bacterium]|nr:class II aldolase/adducin family protein [Elusimicrobiales bacterium]
MKNEYVSEREIIAEIAHKAGQSTAYTQGAGGNVSVKTADGKMIIKASGCRLKDVSPEYGLACVSLDPVKEMLSRDEISGTEFGLAISLAQFPLCGKKARPSVETGFHAMLPRYVIHHHSVYANFISCCRSGLEMSMELFPECRFIPFCMPGMELCLAIRENLKDRPLRSDKAEIFFFANHGLAVAAGDAETACKAMHYVNDSIKKYYRLPVFCPCPDSHSVPGCLTLDQLLYLPDPSQKPSSETEKEILAAAKFICSEHKKAGLSSSYISRALS